jgi:hypothetical protein
VEIQKAGRECGEDEERCLQAGVGEGEPEALGEGGRNGGTALGGGFELGRSQYEPIVAEKLQEVFFLRAEK